MQEENSIGKYLMVAVLIGGAFFYSQGSRKDIPLPKDGEFVGRVTNSVPVIVRQVSVAMRVVSGLSLSAMKP